MTERRQPPRVTLFESGWLEALTLISARWFVVIWAVALPLIAFVGWGSADLLTALALFALGVLVWTLFEYVAHRHAFHWRPKWAAAKWLVFLIHGNHHEAPGDPMRNLMPPIVSLPIAALVWFVWVEAIGSAGTWAFLGWITGYVSYDLVHFACHQYPMRGKIGQAFKRHHMRHHHVSESGNFAITAIFWDRVFGTHVNFVPGAASRKHS